MTNFEAGVRIPMIIRAPWLRNSVGKVTNVIAEAVDLYLLRQTFLLLILSPPDPQTYLGR